MELPERINLSLPEIVIVLIARLSMLSVLFGFALASCGGSNTSNALVVAANRTFDLTPSVEQSNFRLVQTAPAAASNDFLYVGNLGNNSITVYHHDAQANAAPIAVIVGSKTGLSAPGQLSEDADSNLYVANGAYASPSNNPAILVFSHGANGNVAPIRKLAGALTGIHSVQAMTVDQATGKIFVVDSPAPDNECPINGFLLRFPPNASGNIAPFARSNNICRSARQIASDSSNNNLIWAVPFFDVSINDQGVFTYAKQFANGTAPSGGIDIGGFSVSGIADDPTTKTYLVTNGAGIYRLVETTFGDGPNGTVPQHLSPPPVSMITSETCGGQIVLGFLRNIYVVHDCGGNSASAINVYTHDASGNVPPLRILSGPATQLNKPYGIYEGK